MALVPAAQGPGPTLHTGAALPTALRHRPACWPKPWLSEGPAPPADAVILGHCWGGMALSGHSEPASIVD